jgi:mannose/fructose-specific phosphotransferase system component IIA
MNDDTYNGWKNKETWLVNVHGLLDMPGDMEEAARRAYEPEQNLHAAVSAVEDEIEAQLEEAEDYARELLDQGGHAGALFLLDMLGTALARVDTRRLAEHVVADMPDLYEASVEAEKEAKL